MRKSIIALSVLTLSSFAHADLALELQAKNCANESSHCRVIVAPKKIEKQGYCVGIFMKNLPCLVSYISVKEGAAMNITCGTDPQNPVLNQDMAAEAMGYNVATLTKNAAGEDVLRNDTNGYSMISNRMVEVNLIDSDSNGILSTKGEIYLSLQMGRIPLTDVTCK